MLFIVSETSHDVAATTTAAAAFATASAAGVIIINVTALGGLWLPSQLFQPALSSSLSL
jgi:hypothetical protein